jgi:ankyrin repeat protein
VRAGRLAVAALLLDEYGADPNLSITSQLELVDRMAVGANPMTFAIESGNEQLVRLLLRHGCTHAHITQTRGENGLSPLQLAYNHATIKKIEKLKVCGLSCLV